MKYFPVSVSLVKEIFPVSQSLAVGHIWLQNVAQSECHLTNLRMSVLCKENPECRCHLSWVSSNFIYAIITTKCNKQYIGQIMLAEQRKDLLRGDGKQECSLGNTSTKDIKTLLLEFIKAPLRCDG